MKPKVEFKDLKTTFAKVKFLLETNPSLRNNNMRLVSSFFFHEVGKEAVENMDALDLLALIQNNKVTSFHTIERTRRKVQIKHPELSAVFESQIKKPSITEILKSIK